MRVVAGIVPAMTFVNVGTLGALPGRRDELIALLTRPSSVLGDIGCLAYEVGIDDSHPDTVFVMELWESAEAHHPPVGLAAPDLSLDADAPRRGTGCGRRGAPRPERSGTHR